jgi:predicted AlkP superfamily pyrophosphatase or phosphodiesterase
MFLKFVKRNKAVNKKILDKKMKRVVFLTYIFILFFITNISAQKLEQPKLVVGIVVDQMRFNDLYRYYDLYSEKGFKKLVKEGSNFTYAHYNYIPTNTGPGHASIYTGTTPYYHGIINNDFYDRASKKTIYCVNDPDVISIGSNDDEGKKSPKNLLATTITDALKLFTNKQSKVISISIKDRGAILPAGFLADGVFWYNSKTGDFISSSFYMKDLPEWVKNFNKLKLADKYLSGEWNLLLDKKFYEINSPDESPYEPDFFKEGKTSFPHSFKDLKDTEKYNALAFTPFVHEILVELAKSAIKNEKLGKNSVPDFLAVSFSSTDLIGHTWGNYSYELMDTYLRLDRQLADLIEFLDKEIGQKNYILFLTSDHGAVETPAYLRDNKIPSGELTNSKILDSLKAFTARKFKTDKIIEFYSYGFIYLDRNEIEKNGLDYYKVEKEIELYLRNVFPEIQTIARRSELEKLSAARDNENLILNGWHPAKSADIIFTLRPGYMFRFLEKGTTHGTPYTFDTHIPLIFYGWKIPSQTINEKVFIVDIAPTIANLLKIAEPNTCIGVPLIK